MLATYERLVACILDCSLKIGPKLEIVAFAGIECELLRFGLNNDGAVAHHYQRINLTNSLFPGDGLPDINVSENLVDAEYTFQACGGELLGERTAIGHSGRRIGLVAIHPIERGFVES